MEYNEFGSGGVLAATSFAPRLLIYSPVILDTGALIGGIGVITYPILVGSGGVLAGGTQQLIEFVRGSGGAIVGGDIIAESPVYTFRGSGVINVSGDAVDQLGYRYLGSGDIVMGGNSLMNLGLSFTSSGLSDNKPPEYAGISVGYLNDQRPATYSMTFDKNLKLKWNVNAYVQRDLTLIWNVGKLRAYWYRVEGVQTADGCPFLNMHDGCACRIWINNIIARTPAELCQKLKNIAPGLKISSVKRFLKPAESSAIAEDAANGITYECIDTEEIDLCSNPSCADFCIDFDLANPTNTQSWGFNMTVQMNAFQSYQGNGTITMGGSASASYIGTGVNYVYNGTGGITMGGAGTAIPSHYGYIGTGGITMGGSPSVIYDDWHYIGGIWPYVSNELRGTSTGQVTVFGNDNPWINPDFVLADDSQSATSSIALGRFSQLLFIKNLGIEIPSDKNIIGMRLFVKRFANISARDSEVYLVNANGSSYTVLTANKAKTTLWPLAFESETVYGSTTDNWLNDTIGAITADDINDPNFAIAIRVKPASTTAGAFASIQSVKLIVYYEDATDQKIAMGGTATTVSSAYSYRGRGVINVSGSHKLKVNHKFRSLGRGNVGPTFAGIDVGGFFTRSFNYTGNGNIVVGGTGNSKTSYWAYDGTGGIDMSGTCTTKSSNYNYTGTGGMVISGTPRLKARYKFTGSGDITVGGSAFSKQEYVYIGGGDIIVSGNGSFVSPNWNYTGSGNIVVSGTGGNSLIDTDPTIVGYDMQVQNLQIQYNSSASTETITPEVGNVLACQCSSMPFKITLSTNLFTGSKLKQFLIRNNISLPRVFNMYYNTLYNAWQHNNSFRGLSGDGSTREHWNLVFSLTCTNKLAGSDIGEKIWIFSVYVNETNLQTQADQDSHISIGFLPSGICTNQNNLFKVNLNVNSQTKQIVPSPTTTIYQSVFYDNIGLFKDAVWSNSPVVNFTISQVGVPDSLKSIPLVV